MTTYLNRYVTITEGAALCGPGGSVDTIKRRLKADDLPSARKREGDSKGTWEFQLADLVQLGLLDPSTLPDEPNLDDLLPKSAPSATCRPSARSCSSPSSSSRPPPRPWSARTGRPPTTAASPRTSARTAATDERRPAHHRRQDQEGPVVDHPVRQRPLPGPGALRRRGCRRRVARRRLPRARHGGTAPEADTYRNLKPAKVRSTLTDIQKVRTPVQVVFDSLIRMRYDQLQAGNPERRATVISYWNNHILPFLQRFIDAPDGPCIQDVILEVGIEFVLHLAGRNSGAKSAELAGKDLWALGGEELTGLQAAARAGIRPNALNGKRQLGKVEATKAADGTWRYTHAGLRAAGPLGDVVRGSGLSQDCAREILTVLKMVLKHAKALGALDVPDICSALTAVEPHKADRLNAERDPGRPSTLAEVAHVAAHLHVIWQLVLWMLRLLGLRIGEAFGPLVGDFLDLGDVALLVVDRQGGRAFLKRDEHGHLVLSGFNDPKTPQSVRVLPLPAALAELIRIIIRAFHTDPVTGLVDLQARLVPWIGKEHGGQGAFGTALAKVAALVDLEGVNLNPHSMRAHLITEIHDRTMVQDWVARRWAGHAAGKDVHARHYHGDHPEMRRLKALTAELDAMVQTDLGGSIIVATTVVPKMDRGSALRERWPVALDVLRTCGVMPDPLLQDDDALLDAKTIAEIWDESVEVTRRTLARGAVPVEPVTRSGRVEHRARRSVVLAEQKRRSTLRSVPDAAAECGLDYELAKRMLVKLGHAVTIDDITRWKVLNEAGATALREAAEHDQALQARSVRVNEAADMIGCGHTQGRHLLAIETLVRDPETDYAGRTYVTRASVEQARQQWQAANKPRQRVRRAWLPAEETGLTQEELKILVDMQQVGQRQSGRVKEYNRVDLLGWATAHRTELCRRLNEAG